MSATQLPVYSLPEITVTAKPIKEKKLGRTPVYILLGGLAMTAIGLIVWEQVEKHHE